MTCPQSRTECVAPPGPSPGLHCVARDSEGRTWEVPRHPVLSSHLSRGHPLSPPISLRRHHRSEPRRLPSLLQSLLHEAASGRLSNCKPLHVVFLQLETRQKLLGVKPHPFSFIHDPCGLHSGQRPPRPPLPRAQGTLAMLSGECLETSEGRPTAAAPGLDPQRVLPHP